jgi:transcription elongation factor Elf1
MKNFIKLERIISEEQLAEIERNTTKKYTQVDVRDLLRKMGTSFCGCGAVSTHQAIFDVEGGTAIERYCSSCIENQKHIKEGEINVFNFDQFFDALPEYRETLRQRYEESLNQSQSQSQK